MKPTILLLAGTAEARAFAERFDDPRFRLVASLAGVTSDPLPYACETRVGGFGGTGPMVQWMRDERVVAVVDASHPFAERITANAVVAADACVVKRLALRRLPWQAELNWLEFNDLKQAIDALPEDIRALLTTGRGHVSIFAGRPDVSFILRSIEPVRGLPPNVKELLGRPPYSLEEECVLLRDNAITHLVTKNSGGQRSAKLDAAASLGVEVFSVRMPEPPSGEVVSSVDAALDWIAAL